jgi:hypothetical protein
MCQTKQAGFKLDKDDSCDQMFNYLRVLHRDLREEWAGRSKVSTASSSSSSAAASAEPSRRKISGQVLSRMPLRKVVEPSLIASLDFVMSGHRTQNVFSYAPTGMAQPRDAGGFPTHTNCIFTVLWGDGENRTPAVLFTYNKAFKRWPNPTERRKQAEKKLDKTLKKYNIDPKRVVYVDLGKNSSKTYVPESADLVRRFFDLWPIPEGAVALSDNGNSVATTKTADGRTPVERAGFAKHLQYPAAVHQFLSPNDNRFHGAAKQRWRQSGVDRKDDVESSIRLLFDLDASMDHVGKWFDANLQLDKATPTMAGVESVVMAGSASRTAFLKDCRFEYLVETGQDGRGEVASVPKGLESGLNGHVYATKAMSRRLSK